MLANMMTHLYIDFMIGHVFTVQNAEKKDILHFLTSSEDNLFVIKKKDMSSKKRMYGNSKYNYLIERELICLENFKRFKHY